MRVVFLQDSGINESLAITDLSAVLRAAGHETKLFLEDEEADLDADLRAYDPGLVIIPCPVAGETWPVEAARRVKRLLPRCVVLLGGTHVTFAPEVALDHAVDAVCVGEAEGAAVDLADRIAAGKDWDDVANLAFARDGALVRNPMRAHVKDLDALPFPDRELYYRYKFIARFPWKKFTTGRGCMHSCTFCWNSTLREMYLPHGVDFVRRKSPERVVQEIELVKARWPTKRIHFSDDIFTFRPSWLEAFAPLYRERVDVPFTCNSSVELVNERVVDALRDAGCKGVAIGVETGNEELRSRILNKRVTNDDIRRAASLVKSRGLELTTFNMLASPGETLEDALSTLRLNREIGADFTRVKLAVPIPHTRFADKAAEAGEYDGGAGNLAKPRVVFKKSESRQFLNLFYLFPLGVRIPGAERVIRRLLPFRLPVEPLGVLGPIEERRIYDLPWVAGFRYFRHVGNPMKRTANYVTLI